VNGRDTLRVQDSLQRRLEVAGPCQCLPTHPRECLRKYVTPGISKNHKRAFLSVCLTLRASSHLTCGRPSFPRHRFCRGRPRALVGIDDLFLSPLNPRIYGVGRLFSVIVGVHPANLWGQTCRRMSQCRQRMPVSACERACVSMTVHMFFLSIPLDFSFVLRSDVNRFPRVSLVVVLFVRLPSTRTRTRQGPVQILVEPFILPATCQRGYSALNTIVCLPNTRTHAHLRSVGVEGLSSGSIPATKTHRTSQNMRIHGECIQKGRERRAEDNGIGQLSLLRVPS
jgi:hypothetical protein